MRKIILVMHTSLDGFVAGENGAIDWVRVDEQLFDFVGKMTDQSDTALYGRVTYQMMDSYWPTAGDKENPTKHDIEHSNWYNKVTKVVLSKSMVDGDIVNTRIIGGDVKENVQKLKNESGSNILIFGSPSASNVLMQYNLIDEYWLFVNPVMLGAGIPLFSKVGESIYLHFIESKNFSSGVIGLHYSKTND